MSYVIRLLERTMQFLQPAFVDTLAVRVFIHLSQRLLALDEESLRLLKKENADWLMHSVRVFASYGTVEPEFTVNDVMK